MIFGMDIGGKKVCVIRAFDKTDKPTVHILSVYAPGSGFCVEVAGVGRSNMNGVFDSFYIFRGKSEVIVI